jgi:hypothetical protein
MRRPDTNTVLRVWLLASAVGLAIVMIWALAPLLVFVLLLTLGLGLLAAIMVGFSRLLQRWRPPPRS